MSDRYTSLTVTAVLVLLPLLGLGSATAQSTPSAQTAVTRLNQLGPENEAVARRVGLWDVIETVWAAPNAEPDVQTGATAERRMLGSYLEETIRSPSGAVLRIDYLTFNRVIGRWDYVSMDTRAPVGIMPATSYGRESDGRILVTFVPLVVVGSGSEPTGQMLRLTETVTDQDADHDTKDQTFILADGSGTAWLAHRYAYARRP